MFHDSCVETEEQIGRAPYNIELAAYEYLGSLLDLVDRQWITESDFTGLTKEQKIEGLQAKIFFMNKTAETVRMIPEYIFTNEEAKQQMISAIQEVQDDLVIQEEGTDIPQDDKDGILGEVDVGNISILSDIAQQMGYDLPDAKADSKIPGVLATQETLPANNQVVSTSESDMSVDDVTASVESLVAADQAESNQVESKVVAEESYAGKSNGELISIQDEKLARADELFLQKGEKYVFDSALDALKASLEKGDSIYQALKSIASERGRSFAEGLKVSITPDRETTAIRLIPPEKSLKGLSPEALTALVKTAIDVLQESQNEKFKGVDFNTLDKELSELKFAISSLDNAMSSKPKGRSKGDKLFYQLERRDITVAAFGAAGAIELSGKSNSHNDVDDRDSQEQERLKKVAGRGTAPVRMPFRGGSVDGEDGGEPEFEFEPSAASESGLGYEPEVGAPEDAGFESSDDSSGGGGGGGSDDEGDDSGYDADDDQEPDSNENPTFEDNADNDQGIDDTNIN